MSRSNPSEHGTPNPAIRWFEWNGEHGVVRYYDKDIKKTVDVGSDFTFILLDQLGSVRGWHEASTSAIYSNEVKDTRQEVLIVKAFKAKAPLAEGLYRDIKDRVNTLGGQFNANCYIGFKNGDGLAIGSLRFKGAALGAWMEFSKAHRSDLYQQAIRIHGYTEGKKGRIVYRMPKLEVQELSRETHAVATELDAELQAFFATYFARTTHDRAQDADDEPDTDDPLQSDEYGKPLDDDIPF